MAAGPAHEGIFLDPGKRIKPELGAQLKNDLLQRTPDDINYEPDNVTSEDEGREAWKDHKGTLEDQNKEWDNAFAKLTKDLQSEKHNEAGNKDLEEAMKAIGVSTNPEQTDAQRVQEATKFREKYFPGGKRDIGKFVKDVAKDFEDADGNVDMDKLEQRLDLLKDNEVMNSFGSDSKHIVADKAMLYALLSQKDPEKKNAIADATVEQAQQYLPKGPEKDRMQRLYNKTEALKRLRQKESSSPQGEGEETEAGTKGAAEESGSSTKYQEFMDRFGPLLDKLKTDYGNNGLDGIGRIGYEIKLTDEDRQNLQELATKTQQELDGNPKYQEVQKEVDRHMAETKGFDVSMAFGDAVIQNDQISAVTYDGARINLPPEAFALWEKHLSVTYIEDVLLKSKGGLAAHNVLKFVENLQPTPPAETGTDTTEPHQASKPETPTGKEPAGATATHEAAKEPEHATLIFASGQKFIDQSTEPESEVAITNIDPHSGEITLDNGVEPLTATELQELLELNEFAFKLEQDQTLLDKTTNKEIKITHIDEEDGIVTLQLPDGQNMFYRKDQINDFLKKNEFSLEPANEPAFPEASAEDSPEAQTEDPLRRQLTEGAEFNYMGTHGTIDEGVIEGDRVKVKYDDGSTGEIPLERVRDQGRFTLLSKPETADEAAPTQT